MYEAFFELSSRPFAATPRVESYCPASSAETARQSLVRCVERGAGVGLLVGPAGTGKTLLLRLLAQQFRGRFGTAHLACTHLVKRRALLQAILYELGRRYRGLDEAELRLSLIDYATRSDECPSGLLLLIDEAQSLPLRLLEEVRMITNLVRGGQPAVRLVLAGNPELEERLASPKLAALAQRVTARCYLDPLTRDETVAFIQAQIEGSGGAPESVFTPEACEQVFRATDGLPRLVNQLCDHALVLAYAGGVRQVVAAGIEEAWSDLQQLPLPHGDSPTIHPLPGEAESVIEFGSLDDSPRGDAEPIGPATPAASRPADQQWADGPERADPGRGLGADVASVYARSPEQQLRRLEEQFDALDEEFRPAGTIGPEVEFRFCPPKPAAHEFEEEEVVLDRYAELTESVWRGRPQVTSPQSYLLAQQLEVVSWPRAVRLHVAEDRVGSDPAPGRAASTGLPVDTRLQSPGTTGQPTEPFVADAASVNVASCESAVGPLAGQAPCAAASPADRAAANRGPAQDAAGTACSTSEGPTAPPETQPLIVVEDDEVDSPVDEACDAATPAASVSAVRPQQYRQLFARLRGA